MYKLSMEFSDYYSSKDHFIVEDLFNFEAGVDGSEDNGVFDAVNGNSTEFSNVDGGNGYHNSLNSGYGQHFSADFCQPCEEVAELEWLSNFMEDCFSNKDNPKPQFSHANSSSSSIQTQVSSPLITSSPTLMNPVPAKTRSKRSRAKPTNWSSHLPILSPPPPPSPSQSSDSVLDEPKTRNPMRCLHCGSDKTPQWRMGPMGPKTLCNACGVRYKSGRLVPEYRPAASPSFVVSEHSNSHRKVVELRRQKEKEKQHQHQHQMHFWS